MAACVWQMLTAFITIVTLQFSAVCGMYGCMCVIEHPQQKFCHAEFVITGRMVNMEWILIPWMIPTDEPRTETMPQTQNWGPIQEFDSDSPQWSKEADGVNGLHLRPLQQNDDPLGGHGRRETQIPNGYESREEFMMEPRNYNVIYEIEVDHIYKESDRMRMRPGEIVRILAPPPQRSFPMCSFSAMRMKRLYLFVVQNSDMMNACDWVEEYRSLSSKQKQGLKGSYRKGCNACQINLSQNGMSQFNQEVNGNSTCVAEMDGSMVTFPDYTQSDCYAQHSHCVRRKSKCKWYSSKDFKKCKKSMRDNAIVEADV